MSSGSTPYRSPKAGARLDGGADRDRVGDVDDQADDVDLVDLGSDAGNDRDERAGVEFAHPAARMERVVSELANLLGGGRAQLMRGSDAMPLKLGLPLRHEPGIMVTGMGPRMRRTSAKHASGWLPAFFSRDLLPRYIAELRQIRADTGLDPNVFTVIVGPKLVVDPDLRRGRDTAASNLAWYIAAMGTYCADSLRMQRLADEVEAVIAANPRPKPGGCVIPSDAEVLMEQLSVVCTPEDASVTSLRGTPSAMSRRCCSHPGCHASNRSI